MLDLEWSFTARTDLLAIVDYISDDSSDAAQRLKNEIESKARMLPEHPELYRVGRLAGMRELVVHSNYILVYKVGPSSVRILRVLHAARQWPPVEC